MLQQTQVSTVLAYYPRFLARFPDVASLAAAAPEEVLALWSGLGYYSRARHLHRCAQQVVAEHGGRFPASAQALQALPGIGRSTAAAIAAFCFGERAAILDGNVKRVLTRVLGVAQDISQPAHERALWQQAQALLPTHELHRAMPAYTQGLMDLGATVCTRSRPRCDACPLRPRCVAAAQGQPERYPVKTRRVQRRAQSLWLLHLHDAQQRVWLHTRPARGIWAGLHGLPVFDSLAACTHALGGAGGPGDPEGGLLHEHPPVAHALTHLDLQLHFVSVPMPTGQVPAGLQAALAGQWHGAHAWPALGLPAPVRRFLEQQQSRV